MSTHKDERLRRESNYLCNEGASLWFFGNLNDAIAKYFRAIEISPGNPYPYWGLGNCYYDKEQYRDALTAYKANLELAGNEPGIFVVGRVKELEKQLKQS